uniref:Uncharacterized protein n=1 Tax=Echinococcus granulosus TaxID=6210 RepID=U6J9G6_ECHGR|nr:hypothetical protein EgrG_001139100 [Echinococcus granulosus]CDS20695.1 hypothetical protein EgrG_001139300 [Echinococcus granulosus]
MTNDEKGEEWVEESVDREGNKDGIKRLHWTTTFSSPYSTSHGAHIKVRRR